MLEKNFFNIVFICEYDISAPSSLKRGEISEQTRIIPPL